MRAVSSSTDAPGKSVHGGSKCTHVAVVGHLGHRHHDLRSRHPRDARHHRDGRGRHAEERHEHRIRRPEVHVRQIHERQAFLDGADDGAHVGPLPRDQNRVVEAPAAIQQPGIPDAVLLLRVDREAARQRAETNAARVEPHEVRRDHDQRAGSRGPARARRPRPARSASRAPRRRATARSGRARCAPGCGSSAARFAPAPAPAWRESRRAGW